MKLPFSRKSANTDSVPEEIQNYYQSERRDRSGVAWLLALGTLMVTLVVAFGLFFGGRWAYRKIANRDKPAETSQTAQNGEQQEVGSDSDGSTSTPTPSTSSPSTGTSSTSTSTPSPASSTAGATTTSLPNTGPTEE